MQLLCLLFAVTIIIVTISYSTAFTSTQPPSNGTAALPSIQPVDISSLLPLTGSALISTLRCALDIASNGPRKIKRPCRQDYGRDARLLLRFLAQDPNQAPSSSEASSQESSSPLKRPRPNDEVDYCEPSTSSGSYRRTSLETMQKIVLLSSTRSEAGIRKMYPWYRRQYLPDFKRCVDEGGSHSMQRNRINEVVSRNVSDRLDSNLPLKTYMLKAFARIQAKKMNVTWFKASDHWVNNFKKNNMLCSRKVTQYMSRPRIENQDIVDENILEFLNNYTRISENFPRRLIWNVDQSAVQYESTNDRVVARKGSRDVLLRVDNLNKNTHSFTAQPILTRDGRLLGRLLLCMQEESNEFGPIVGPRMRQLEREYGNVRIISSRSGKMTTNLTIDWIRNVLRPAMNEQMRRLDSLNEYLIIANTEETANKRLLLLSDSWSGQTNEQVRREQSDMFTLVIPPHTTGTLQPLDVGFFRQLKIFIRRITEEALVLGRVADVSSREGAINLLSLIHNQFQSPAYHDLWRYAWRHTDPFWSQDELSMTRPPNVNSIQFGSGLSTQCEIDNCTHDAVIQCSYDGVSMCLDHFLNRSHFHDNDEDGDRIALGVEFEPGYDDEDHVDEEDEDEDLERYVPEPYPLRNITRGSSTTTPKPIGGDFNIWPQIETISHDLGFRRRRSFVGQKLLKPTLQSMPNNTRESK